MYWLPSALTELPLFFSMYIAASPRLLSEWQHFCNSSSGDVKIRCKPWRVDAACRDITAVGGPTHPYDPVQVPERFKHCNIDAGARFNKSHDLMSLFLQRMYFSQTYGYEHMSACSNRLTCFKVLAKDILVMPQALSMHSNHEQKQ